MTAAQNRPVRAALFFAVFYIGFFSPVLFSGKILAPGDGVFFYYPHYNSPVQLWDPLLMTGYPAMADPQLMNWYPLALLLRLIPGSWNAFIVLAYVLASWFMYLFVRQLTGKDFSGLLSGLIFGLCGFMNAHLGHVTMIQTAVWIPAMLFCLEKLAHGTSRWRWVVLGGWCAGACLLAGHPQIALYGIALVSGYAIVRGFSMASAKWQYYAAAFLMLACGLALCAIQLLPTAQTSGFSTRATLGFADFSQHALPPSQLSTLLFPNLFGAVGTTFLSGIPYFGSSSITEMAGYTGFAALVLAAIAAISRRTVGVFFWLACMAVSLLAAMGAATPLGRLLYALPAFGQFRAQARFLLIFGIAASVLAGYGLTAIAERINPVRNALLAVIAALGLVLYAGRIALADAAPLRKAALAAGARDFSASPFHNSWMGAALLLGCCTCAMLVLLIWKPDSLARKASFGFLVIVELAQFSWYGDWRFNSPNAQVFNEPEVVRRVRPAVRKQNARWVPVRGDLGKPAEAPGDLPILWNLPSLAKYGPLLPSRYKELLNMETNSRFLGQWWDPGNRAFDIAGGRFIAVPEIRNTAVEDFRGVRYASEDLALSVGRECGSDAVSSTIPLPQPQEIRGIALVTLTGCSTNIGQGTVVAEILLKVPNSAAIPLQIREGVETSEWAASCADVSPVIRHRVAEIYSRKEVRRGAGTCPAQTYASVFVLPKPVTISGMEIRWMPAKGMLKIGKISLLGPKPGESQPLSRQGVRFGDSARWSRLDAAGGVEVYENLRAQPRAWLVPRIVSARPPDIVRAIQTSRLPDGTPYDPAAVALVEEPLAFQSPASDPHASSSLVEDKGASVEIRTSSSQPAFLVLADFYYPGWQATVNGRPAHIFQTNYIQRGLMLPPGTNSVRFKFRPPQFLIGAAISFMALAAMLGVSLFLYRRERTSGQRGPAIRQALGPLKTELPN